MNSQRRAFDDFRELTRHLPELTEREQIMTLQYELLVALERAHDFQTRSRELDSRLAQLDAQAGAKTSHDETVRRHLGAELERAVQRLETERRTHDKELRTLRLERLAAEMQSEALEEMCRHLLIIIDGQVDDLCEVHEQDAATASPKESAS